MIADKLKAKGWTELDTGAYEKGDWLIELDTSSWMTVSTAANPRVFDVPVPGEYESQWTANLIEHLCGLDDERCRLRTVLQMIRDNPQHASQAAAEALQVCHHSWLVNLQVPGSQLGRVYCSICGQLRRG